MNLTFSPRAWYEYTGWQLEDRKTLKRINALIKDIERNGNTGIGKPEPLRNFEGYWSRRINEADRLVYKISGTNTPESGDNRVLYIVQCKSHYE
jgi:toxin YoeB